MVKKLYFFSSIDINLHRIVKKAKFSAFYTDTYIFHIDLCAIILTIINIENYSRNYNVLIIFT